MLHLPQMIPEYGTMLSGSLHNFLGWWVFHCYSEWNLFIILSKLSLVFMTINIFCFEREKIPFRWSCSELLTVTAVLEQCVTYAVLLVVWFFPSFFDFQSIVVVPFSASSIRLKSCQLDMHKACRTQAGSTMIWCSHVIKHDASFCADAKLPQ